MIEDPTATAQFCQSQGANSNEPSPYSPRGGLKRYLPAPSLDADHTSDDLITAKGGIELEDIIPFGNECDAIIAFVNT